MHSWVTRIRTRGYIDVIKGNPDLHKYHPTDDSDPQVKYPHMHKYLQVPIGTYGYPQPIIYFFTPLLQINIIHHVVIILSSSSVIETMILLPFGRLPFSRKTAIISFCGTAPGRSHHAPSTEAARVLSSEREWRIFETVSPPREKALSTSVDVAK